VDGLVNVANNYIFAKELFGTMEESSSPKNFARFQIITYSTFAAC